MWALGLLVGLILVFMAVGGIFSHGKKTANTPVLELKPEEEKKDLGATPGKGKSMNPLIKDVRVLANKAIDIYDDVTGELLGTIQAGEKLVDSEWGKGEGWAETTFAGFVSVKAKTIQTVARDITVAPNPSPSVTPSTPAAASA